MTDNELQIEEGYLGRLPSSRYSSFLDKNIIISVKNVSVYDCIQILTGLNRYFNLSIVSVKKRGGVS